MFCIKKFYYCIIYIYNPIQSTLVEIVNNKLYKILYFKKLILDFCVQLLKIASGNEPICAIYSNKWTADSPKAEYGRYSY